MLLHSLVDASQAGWSPGYAALRTQKCLKQGGVWGSNPLGTVQGLGAHPSTLKMALEGLEGLTEPSQALARLSHTASVPELVLPRHATPHHIGATRAGAHRDPCQGQPSSFFSRLFLTAVPPQCCFRV